MILQLRYGDDYADVRCVCRVTRADSPQEFVYLLKGLHSKFDTVRSNQHDYFFPNFTTIGYAYLGAWASSEEDAREAAIDAIVAAFDEFNEWPQYRDHGYLPGETYEGEEEPTPPGQDPYGEQRPPPPEDPPAPNAPSQGPEE